METVVDLSACAPTAQRVIDALKTCELVTTSVDNSYLFAEGNRDFLYSIDIWSQVDMVRECIAIDQFTARLCSSNIFQSSSIDTSNSAIRRHY